MVCATLVTKNYSSSNIPEWGIFDLDDAKLVKIEYTGKWYIQSCWWKASQGQIHHNMVYSTLLMKKWSSLNMPVYGIFNLANEKLVKVEYTGIWYITLYDLTPTYFHFQGQKYHVRVFSTITNFSLAKSDLPSPGILDLD